MADSVPLGKVATEAAPRATAALGIQPLIILFLLYVFAGSDIFVENILSGFEGTTRPLSGEVTNRGVIVSGIFLVMAYAAVLWLIDGGIL